MVAGAIKRKGVDYFFHELAVYRRVQLTVANQTIENIQRRPRKQYYSRRSGKMVKTMR